MRVGFSMCGSHDHRHEPAFTEAMGEMLQAAVKAVDRPEPVADDTAWMGRVADALEKPDINSLLDAMRQADKIGGTP